MLHVLLSDYYGIYTMQEQFTTCNRKFLRTVLLECINESISSIVHYNFPQMLNDIYFTFPYYAVMILNAFNDPLCSKLCWQNWRVPSQKLVIMDASILLAKLLE